MQVKFFQRLANISNWYMGILRDYEFYKEGKEWAVTVLEARGLKVEDETLIREEVDAVEYLITTRTGIAQKEAEFNIFGIDKPKIEVVNRMLARYEAQLDELIARGTKRYAHSKELDLYYKKQKECVRYYRFKFTLPAWYRGLPERNKTYDEYFNKAYPELEETLPIPTINEI